MKKKLALLIITYLSLQVYPQIKFNIIVHSNSVLKSENVYISGDNSKLGDWQENAAKKLNRINDTTFSLSIEFEKKQIIQFKLTKGKWSNEALNEEGSIPGNEIINLVSDTTIYISVKGWKTQISRYIVKGQITGTVKYHKAMAGAGILARDVIVWLPPFYDKNKTERYSVIYAHDGQNLFDPNTASFGVDWQLDETADSLIRCGKIKGLIIVGIYCTQDRFADYSYGTKGEAYMNFIVNTLKPFIDKTYRTIPDRKNTFTWGSSMGGLISFMLAWQHTDVFSKAACFSPAFKISELNYTNYIKEYKGTKKDIQLYIDNGGVDLDAKLLPGIEETVQLLDTMGYKTNKELTFFIDKKASHNEAAWSKRVYMPLELFLGK